MPVVTARDLQDLILHQVETFGRTTYKEIGDTYTRDLEETTQRWKCGWDIWDTIFPTLRHGTIFIVAPPNIGKSNFVLNWMRGILDNTEDSMVVDLVLDDTRDKRHQFLAASTGRMHLKDIILPCALDPQDKRRDDRTEAYRTVQKRYGRRVEIMDGDSLSGTAYQYDSIEMYLEILREEFPEKKIWVNIDAFDNVKPGKDFDPKSEKMEQYKSRKFKELAERLDMIVLFTKHQVKNNRGRFASSDIASGSGDMEYDASVFLLFYCEVAEMGQSAEIFFEREDKEEEKCPILEVMVSKNKGGEFKKKYVYFNQYPEQYFVSECDAEDQEYYRDEIMSQMGSKPTRKKKD